MGELENRKNAFVSLGEYLRTGFKQDKEMGAAIERSILLNPWFTKENIEYSFLALGKMLTLENLSNWLSPYQDAFNSKSEQKTVGVVMAGNIPIVGFHDYLSVLISGNKIMAKLSSDDTLMLPVLSKRLIDFYPGFSESINLTEGTIQKPDAVIATGSNNSARYFQYYFGKYPNIIRKNRNGVAVLSGNESEDDFKKLGEDIFRYFGLGCRNVSKIYVPENYKFDRFYEAIESYRWLALHNKFKNNYEYCRSIFLINKVHHFDNEFLIISANENISSPLSVLHYEEYKHLDSLNNVLENRKDEIQCVVSSLDIKGKIGFGQSQLPQLDDYADGVNTLDFLSKL